MPHNPRLVGAMSTWLTRASETAVLTSRRRRGLDAVQRKLLDGLKASGVGGASVLEIGCGTGELQRRVLAAGAAGAVGIDVAAGMVDQAHVRSCRTRLRGLTGRGAQMAAR